VSDWPSVTVCGSGNSMKTKEDDRNGLEWQNS